MIFVIDSSDTDRVGVVVHEWQKIMEHPAVKKSKIPILIFVNKTDIEVRENLIKLSPARIDSLLGLDIYRQQSLRNIKVLPCSGLTGANVTEGFNWYEFHLVLL